jgi:hypothetical protein
MNIIILLLLSIVPQDYNVQQTVDILEINNFYEVYTDPQTKKYDIRIIFRQVVAYEWYFDRQYSIGWWLVNTDAEKKKGLPDKVPLYNYQSGRYEIILPCKEGWSAQFTKISSKILIETWTPYDREAKHRRPGVASPNNQRLYGLGIKPIILPEPTTELEHLPE